MNPTPNTTSTAENLESLLPSGYLRLSQVLKLIPVCKSTWWNGCKSGRFPKPRKLGPRTTAWRARDIHRLLERFEQENTPNE